MGPERDLTPEQVGEIRERRLEQVARALPLDGLVVSDLPDGGLVRRNLDEVARVVGAVLDAFRPQVLIGHDPRGVNAHPDHIATHWALRHALLERPGVRFAMVAYPPSTVEAVKPRLLFATPEDEIDAVVHLSGPEIDAKEEALGIHEAFVTLREGSDSDKLYRPPIERYEFLGEPVQGTVEDVFAGIRTGPAA